MKRAAPSTELDVERQASRGRRRRRQEPVSCKTCRRKKLKCSRTFPCSNCSSRGLDCEPPEGPQWTVARESSSAPVAATTTDPNVLARVLERLQHLENIVSASNSNSTSTATNNRIQTPSIANFDTPIFQSTEGEVHEDEIQDSISRLEVSGSRQDGVSEDSDEFIVSSAPISRLTIELNSKSPTFIATSVVGHKLFRRLCLPDKEEAKILIDCYFQSLGSWYRILHRSTTESMLEDVYSSLTPGRSPNISEVALFLSIFATGAYFSAFSSHLTKVFPSPEQASQASTYWKKNAFDILEHCGRNGLPSSLEQLQTTVIISLLTQNLEGTSKKYRMLHSETITLARDLGLHIMDHPQRKNKTDDIVVSEMKRRAWWVIAATDWLMGTLPGPQEGTYSIRLEHMITKPPMNVDDKDLKVGNDVQSNPLSQPSEMSYGLIRIAGSHVCRQFTDMIQSLAFGISNIDYNEVVALENVCSSFITDLPFYFRLDEESRKRTEPYLAKYPEFATQRYLLQQGFHCHRSRIHRPFLIRGSLDPRYSFSRKACLESVRISLEIRRLLDQERPGIGLPTSRLNFVVHHVFMAALTLALDICFNKSIDQDEDTIRRADLAEACKMLDDARKEFHAADRFLKPLLELLRKHKVQLQAPGPENDYMTPPEPVRTHTKQTAPVNTTLDPTETPFDTQQTSGFSYDWIQATQVPVPDMDVDMNSVWTEFLDLAPDANAPQWDSFLADLDYTGPGFG